VNERILLVATPLGFEAVYPLELASVAAALNARGIPCSALDARLEPGCLAGVDNRDRPRAAVLDSSIRNLKQVVETARFLRDRTGCPIIVIGTGAVLNARSLVDTRIIDAVVTGDPEVVVPMLIEKGLPLGRAVHGSVTRGVNGQILEAPPRFTPLGEQAPDRHTFPLASYSCHPIRGARPQAAIEATRGCSLECTFCPVPTRFKGLHRARSVESVLDEMARLERDHGIGVFRFEDEQPLMDRAWFQDLLAGIRNRLPGVQLEFPNGLRPDRVDRDLLGEMAASGTRRLAWGIEAASPGLREDIGRPLDMAHIQRVLRWGHALGLVQAAYFQIGLPGETTADLLRTVSMAASVPVEYPHLSVHWPWREPPGPGTAHSRLSRIRGAAYCLAYASPKRLGALYSAGDIDPRHLPTIVRAFGRWLAAGSVGGGTW
jgi:radical SAM superfamily enzyme YgiQ (UPF0313 family)